MNTTNELPTPDINQKLDAIIDLVISFRAAMVERMDKLEEDSRLRYVDLRQQMTEMETRLTERMDRMEERQMRMEETQAEMRQETTFLVKHFYQIDRKLDVFVNEFSFLKDRLRELETTRELRH